MSGPQWVYTKEIVTPRYHVVPCQPLLDRHATGAVRRWLKEKYGNDVITTIDYKDPDGYLKIVGINNPAKLKENFASLKLLCDKQAERIKELEDMVRKLDRDVRRAGGTPSVSLKQEKHDA